MVEATITLTYGQLADALTAVSRDGQTVYSEDWVMVEAADTIEGIVPGISVTYMPESQEFQITAAPQRKERSD